MFPKLTNWLRFCQSNSPYRRRSADQLVLKYDYKLILYKCPLILKLYNLLAPYYFKNRAFIWPMHNLIYCMFKASVRRPLVLKCWEQVQFIQYYTTVATVYYHITSEYLEPAKSWVSNRHNSTKLSVKWLARLYHARGIILTLHWIRGLHCIFPCHWGCTISL